MEDKIKRKRTPLEKLPVPGREDGQVGIRATLNNMGFSDSSIGFDQNSGMVTLRGKPFMRPGFLDDNAGISYARPSDIQNSLVNFYRDSKNPVVRVSDAFAGTAGKYGLSADALTYGNGTVSVGGKPLDILYIDKEGKAWAWQNRVQDAVKDYAAANAVKSPEELAAAYEQKYLSKAQELLQDLKERPAFTYNPEEDPVYLAYRQQYQAQGDRAAQNALSSYAALTGGYSNSAAVSAAAQAGQHYAQKLSAAIPALAQQAYERYAEKYQQDLKLLDQMTGLYQTAYQNAAGANTKQLENINNAAASNTARDNAARENSRREWEQDWGERFNRQKWEQTDREGYWDELFNTQKLSQNHHTTLGIQLDNRQKEIYQKYYERLLQTQLSGEELDNQLTQEKIKQLYLQNALGY